MKHVYRTNSVCSSNITFDMDENNIVTDISFQGGCNGNLKALSAAVDGWEAKKIIETFENIQCGSRGTSCSAQFAKALTQAVNGENGNV
jgi:uncharacterized protein TIGR03905